MAIEDLGKSLLSRQRTQIAENRKRIEKDIKRGQIINLATMGVKLGNKFLEEKANTFLNSESVMAEKAQYKLAADNADKYYQEQQRITDSGLSDVDYFYKTFRTPFEQRAKEVVPFEKVGDAGAYNSLINKEVTRLATERAEAHRDGMALANKIVDEEDFDSMVALNGKKARPSNIFNFLTRKASKLGRGKSAAEFDKEALASIRNSDMALNSEKMNLFEEEYRRTNNLVSAYDYADFIVPDVPEDQKYIENVTQSVKGVGSKIIITETTETTNRNTGAVKSTVEKEDEIDVDEKTVRELDALATKEARLRFDFAKDGFSQLTATAFSRFSSEVSKTYPDINLATISTMAEQRQVAEIFTEYGNDPKNLKDADRTRFSTAMMDILVTDFTKIEALLNSMESDPVEKKRLENQFIVEFIDLTRRAYTASDGLLDPFNPDDL